MTIQAIETNYKGCRFRSRLEARWAVFFDTMGVEWHYEAEGYELPDRLLVLDRATDGIKYLPDFWLPQLKLYAEVKGSLTPSELARTLTVAAALSSPGGGCGDGYDSVILGPIPPAERRSCFPFRLHLHKGDLVATPWPRPITSITSRNNSSACPAQYSYFQQTVAADTGHIWTTGGWLLEGYATKVGDRWVDAYRAARSARFEHGQCG